MKDDPGQGRGSLLHWGTTWGSRKREPPEKFKIVFLQFGKGRFLFRNLGASLNNFESPVPSCMVELVD